MNLIDKIKEEILFLTVDKDENGDDLFIMGKDFMRFKFKTDDNLLFNQKLNVPVSVISISNVFEKGDWYYPRVDLQDCLYESDYFFIRVETIIIFSITFHVISLL